MNGLVDDQDEWVRYLNNPWKSACPVESPTTRDYSSGAKSADREMFKGRYRLYGYKQYEFPRSCLLGRQYKGGRQSYSKKGNQ